MPDLFSTLIIATALVNALTGIWWGRKYGQATKAQLQNLKSHLDTLTAAKEETIKATEAQLSTLQLQLQELRELTPRTLREYVLYIREQLEEYNRTLKAELEAAQRQNAELERQISVERSKRRATSPRRTEFQLTEAELQQEIVEMKRQLARSQQALSLIKQLERSEVLHAEVLEAVPSAGHGSGRTPSRVQRQIRSRELRLVGRALLARQTDLTPPESMNES